MIYHNICLTLSKRTERQQDMLTDEDNASIEVTKEISKDYCEGLSRMLSSLYSRTTKHLLSATMLWKLFRRGKRS